VLTLLKLKQISIPYYEQWTKKDYYHNLDYPAGQWAGQQSYGLGLSGDVDTKSYKNIMRGFSPDGKTPLVRNAGDNHIPAWDLTFSAPKSFSALHTLDKYSLFSKIQKVAVNAALSYLEQQAAQTRRNAGSKDIEKLPGFLAAIFAHYESRTLDFQTHSHCLTFNVAQRSDGSFGSINSQALYQWKMATGAVYRAELAQQLRLEGFEIEADGDSFNIVGVPLNIRKYYSKRDEEISKILQEVGATTSASKIGEYVKQSTKKNKQLVPLSKLRSGWRTDLKTLYNFTSKTVRAIQKDHPIIPEKFINVNLALDELTQVNSTFKEQDFHHHIAKQAQMTGDRKDSILKIVQDAFASERLVSLSRDYKNNRIYTTTNVIAAETKMIKLAKVLSKQQCKSPSISQLDTAIEQVESLNEYSMSDEQISALKLACGSVMLTIIQGSAGSGKSTALEALRIACENNNQVVKGACIAKTAADNFQKETAISSGTIAMLLSQADKGKRPLKNVNVLIIDEAGQVGAIQMQALLELAHSSNTKVVLVGEDKQLDAIERGGVLRYLSRTNIIRTTRIETIRRQREPWAIKTVMDLRDGNSIDAVDALNTHKALNFSSSYDDAIDHLVEKWKTFTVDNPNKQTIVLAQRWKEVESLSVRLRNIYQERGLVGHENIEFNCSVSNKPMMQQFSIGDRVRFTQNDYRLNVSNGSLATITTIDDMNNSPTLCIALDNGHKVTVNIQTYHDEYGRFPLVHAYAMTVYSSQGITIDGDTFVLYNNHMDRANTYVAGSRHKDNCHWFFNSKEIDLLAKPNNEMVTHDERLQEVAKLMKREQRSTLAIEQLTDIQNEKYLSHLNDIDELINNKTNDYVRL
jgi:conjugative relaxase-like TrwC/TraI family protein